MFRTHKLSFWYQFLVGGNAHIIQGFESEHSYFPTFIVVFSLTACTSHVYPIYYILSMIQCTSILIPCFQSVIQSPRTVLVLPRVLSFVSLSCLAEKIKLLFRNMPSYSCYLHGLTMNCCLLLRKWEILGFLLKIALKIRIVVLTLFLRKF